MQIDFFLYTSFFTRFTRFSICEMSFSREIDIWLIEIVPFLPFFFFPFGIIIIIGGSLDDFKNCFFSLFHYLLAFLLSLFFHFIKANSLNLTDDDT